jgi:hypothetical protein
MVIVSLNEDGRVAEPAAYPGPTKGDLPMIRVPIIHRTLATALMTSILALGSVETMAQTQGTGNEQPESRATMDRGQGDVSRDQLRHQMHSEIDAAGHLSMQERQTMHANLDACFQMNMPGPMLRAAFPGSSHGQMSGEAMIGLQNSVMATGRDGLPVEPMLAKIQEGRTKGVPAPALERACDRMAGYLRAADRIMTQSREHGLEPPKDPVQQRRMHQEMTMQMWRGMSEEGYDQLGDQARMRLRDGNCGIADLVSAGEVATRLQEEGVAGKRAVQVTGEALRHGYRANEMMQLQYMVMNRQRSGGTIDGFMGDMEYCLGSGMQVGQMYEYMMQHGWMGPGHMGGPWGSQHMNNMGGPGNDGCGGGMGDDDHHGGGGDHHGGM